jgi:hypothetical protein
MEPYLVDWRSQDLGSKGQRSCVRFSSITAEITSPTHSYDTTVMPAALLRVSYAFNDSHILKIQVGYSRILLMGSHLYE